MYRKLGEWINRFPILMVLAIAAITAVAVFSLLDPASSYDNPKLQLSIDPSVDALLAEDDPDKEQTDTDNYVFGVSDTIILSVHNPNGGVLAADYLQTIDQLSQQLKQLPQVQQVHSLSSAPSVLSVTINDEWLGNTTSLDSGTISQHAQRYPERHADIKAFMQQSALYQGHLISHDFSSSLIAIQFAPLADDAFNALNIPATLTTLLQAYPNVEVAISGTPIIKHATSTAVLNDLSFTVPAVLGLMALILFAAFRSLRGVWMPLVTIILALIWTMAGMQAVGIPLNLITTIVPPLVMTVGLAYAMHVLTDYYNTRYESGKLIVKAKDLIPDMLDKVGQPVLLAGVTTAAGFMALTLSPVPAVDQFAWASVMGIATSVLLSLTFLPAVLRLFGCPPQRAAGAKVFNRIAQRLTAFNLNYRRGIIAGGLGVIAIALFGATQIEVGSDYIEDFPPEHPVRQDFNTINSQYHGANSFSIIVDGYVNDSFVQPESLQALQSLQRWLNLQPEIGGSLGLVDHIQLLNASLSGDYALPEDAATTKQLIILAGGGSLRGVVDNQFRTTRIQISSRIDNSREIAQLVTRINQRLADLPKPLAAHISGNNILLTKTVDSIASGQLWSISVALLAVLLILALLFTSIRTGLVTLLPNLLPVAVYFGALGWMGIQLGPTTSLIACIVLGIAVDDTIHYLARFNRDARDAANEREGTYKALKGVLRPVTFTTIALVTGFLVLTTSELQNQVRFGALAAFTLFIAWISDITFTPALASKLRIVTLWDVLRLDLGESPQNSIRLFRGLKPRQARIFALLSTVLKLDVDQDLIKMGDTADGSMFIIIDGEFDVWIPDDNAPDGKHILNCLGRGATVGEVGYFTHKRTAYVTAKNDGRVLKFSERSLEKLSRRFPFIAATVFKNLSNIQAERLASVTQAQSIN